MSNFVHHPVINAPVLFHPPQDYYGHQTSGRNSHKPLGNSSLVHHLLSRTVQDAKQLGLSKKLGILKRKQYTDHHYKRTTAITEK